VSACVTDMCLDSGHVSSELQSATLHPVDPSRRDVMTERYKAVRKGCHACIQLAGNYCCQLHSTALPIARAVMLASSLQVIIAANCIVLYCQYCDEFVMVCVCVMGEWVECRRTHDEDPLPLPLFIHTDDIVVKILQYMGILMNEENHWDHDTLCEITEGPADCIPPLEKMKKHKASLSGVVTVMLQAIEEIRVDWLTELCNGIIKGGCGIYLKIGNLVCWYQFPRSRVIPWFEDDIEG